VASSSAVPVRLKLIRQIHCIGWRYGPI
jgi:hypothetical protein